jgi:hypothetical protein
MIKSNSEYRVSTLRNLPPGLLGSETYSVVTATEINVELIRAEYFLLVQRPFATLHQGTIDLNMADFPAEQERWILSTALDEAQRQVDIETENLLERRANELNRTDLAYLPFEFKSAAVSLMSPWMRGLFEKEIRQILQQTKSPRLQVYLSLLIQNSPNTWQWHRE